jgi:hypothetical protein
MTCIKEFYNSEITVILSGSFIFMYDATYFKVVTIILTLNRKEYLQISKPNLTFHVDPLIGIHYM